MTRINRARSAIRNTALDALEFREVLALIALEARSEPGRRAIESREPSNDIETCVRRQTELAEMLQFKQNEGLLPTRALIEPREVFSSGRPIDLVVAWDLLCAMRAVQIIRETFRSTDRYPHLREVVDEIEDLTSVTSEIGKYFTREGKIREDASPTLRSLRSRIIGRRGTIQKTLTTLMRANESAIQDELITMRGDRYCIPVRADNRNAIPGILHERSGSGASFFIEPMAVVEANNDLAEFLIQEREEIARIERLIAGRLAESSEEITRSIDVAAEIDAIQAAAVFAEQAETCRPHFSREARLRIIEGRHPLLDERLTDLRKSAFGETDGNARVIPTTMIIGDDRQALLISGPNAGGKTVALKTAGLIVALATSGLPVPAAEGTIIPVVDQLSVLIGDDQDVMEHRSTFSAYLTRLRYILEDVGQHSLVLLDELGSGTDPEEGAALSAAVVEYLLSAGCLVIATTHIAALKSVALNDSRIENASMEFDSTSGTPTFTMIPGVPGRSRAIETAENIGLPATVIASAREKVGDRYGDMDRLIAELQSRSTRAMEERDSLKRQREDYERRQKELDERIREVEDEQAAVAEDYRTKFDEVRREVRTRVADELKLLREMDRKQRDGVRQKDLVASLERPLGQFERALPQHDAQLEVGCRARHRALGVEGEITELSATKATLRVGSKRMQVSIDDLTVISAPERAVSRQRDRSVSSSDLTPEVGAELNLIGKRVEEAIDESDDFLDKALLARTAAVRLIHGHGTGKLRLALREYLRKHPGVRSFRAGGEREGGDGATIAVLDV